MIFATNFKFYHDINILCTTLKVWNNATIKRVSLIVFFLEMQWKLNKKWILSFVFGWSRNQSKKRIEIFPTMHESFICGSGFYGSLRVNCAEICVDGNTRRQWEFNLAFHPYISWTAVILWLESCGYGCKNKSIDYQSEQQITFLESV